MGRFCLSRVARELYLDFIDASKNSKNYYGFKFRKMFLGKKLQAKNRRKSPKNGKMLSQAARRLFLVLIDASQNSKNYYGLKFHKIFLGKKLHDKNRRKSPKKGVIKALLQQQPKHLRRRAMAQKMPINVLSIQTRDYVVK